MLDNATTTQLQHARTLLQSGQLQAGKQLLTVLANQNVAAAMVDLANVLLIESQSDATIAQARTYLHSAQVQNDADAIYQLAGFDALHANTPNAWQAISQQLQRACQLQNPNALCDAAVLLARMGDETQRTESTALLELAALRGSTTAMALLGERLASGFACMANPARANSIRQLARQMGLPVPAPVNEWGFSAAEPAQIPIITADLNLPSLALQPMQQVAVQSDARIGLQAYAQVFSAEECLYIQCSGAGQLAASVSVDPNGQSHQNRIRTSFDCQFATEQEPLLLKWLQQRMAAYASLPWANAEPLVLLRYTPGQEYKPHRDYLPPSHFTRTKDGGSGQRLRTVIVYLNTPERGGETAFPLLANSIAAQQGQLLHFDNLRADGQLQTNSLHAGLPVIQGVKWICTLWMREQTHRAL